MDDKRKHHKKKKVGKKAKRKKISKGGGAGRGAKNNEAKKYHKAFAFSGGIRSAHRRKQHLFELEEKKLRAPKNFKECSKSSPLIVAIQGPKGVGKTTLLKSLIKHYVGVTINEVRGPVSIITKAMKRYTFIDVNDDILSMIDAAKVADLCLLVIDGSYGLELETLEFVSILNTHGLPKVIGVVTHLDKFKDSKSIRKRKKKLSKRFSDEMVEGAKVFFFSGIQNGRYNRTEVRNFCKFFSSVKRPQISWREQHGYIVGLRLDVEEEDAEEEAAEEGAAAEGAAAVKDGAAAEDGRVCAFLSNCDEQVRIHVEGFVYGAKLFNGQVVHIPNIGDVQIRDIQILQDPFLTDEQKKNPNVYAPMADVGNVAFDLDNMFIHIPKSRVNFTPGELLGGGSGDASGGGSGEGSGEESDEERDENRQRGNPGGEDERYVTEGIRMIRALQRSKYALCGDGGVESEPRLFDEPPLFEPPLLLDGQEEGPRRKAPSNAFVSERQKKKKQAEKYVNEKAREYTELEPILFGKRGAEDDYHCADGVSVSASGGEEGEEVDDDGEDDGEEEEEEEEEDDDDDEEDEEEDDGDDDEEDEEDDDGDDDEEDDDGEDDEEDLAANPANAAYPANSANPPHRGEHRLAQELAFENKASLDAFIYDARYIRRRNSHLYFKGDVLVVMRREKRGLRGEEGGEGEEGEEEEEDLHSVLNLLSADPVREAKKAQPLYSYMHEENYFLDEVDSFKCTQDVVFVFNNLTVSLGDVADEALVEQFFSRYGSLYEGCFGSSGGAAEGEAANGGAARGEEENGGAANGEAADEEANGEAANTASLGDTDGKEQKEQQKERYQETEGVGVLRGNAYGSSVNIGEYIKMAFKIERKKLAMVKKGIIICGGLQTYEEKESMIHCRVKKHRWFPKVLRSNDPLIFSIGWRRYQSIPVYSINERNNVRIRYLKYTTEHMHCNCTFYGPVAGANSGILAICNYKKVPYYRICLNGITLETNTNVRIMKKLKLIGEPYKIFKNTAFVKNMFSSDLEVSKFLNCPVVTPSGIKGLIKSKLAESGNCRCTFADKVRMSDVVILKLYVNVKVKRFFTYDVENKLRSINELRYIYNLYVNHKSNYRTVPFRHFYNSKIHINPKLLKELPYKSKPKLFSKMSNEEELKKEKQRKDEQINFRALENPKVASRWYQMLHTIKKNILEKKREKAKLSYHSKLKKTLMVEEAKQRVVRQRKKLSYRRGRGKAGSHE
ncbi:ribosome biogenesis protein BMS1 [Plasmodium vivax Mauritania I]|uniref:Ribosome biogenesis protein BMS1 n=1 Tax=Plasmodium vivax Mauritania I TaxID=1035515 RepID=A0A0J9TKE3_PLAVI|nr:ribosome biogenesis protein BMS1 [Plasmodium vivax Mauritania I]